MTTKIMLTEVPVKIVTDAQWALLTTNNNGSFCLGTTADKSAFHDIPGSISFGAVSSLYAWVDGPNKPLYVSYE